MKLRKLMSSIKKKDAAINAFVGIVAHAVTIYCAFKAAPKCKGLMEDLKNPDIPKMEKAKKFAVVLGPTITGSVITTGSIIRSYKKNEDLSNTVASLSSSASAIATVMDITEAKTKEIVGEEKAEEIKQHVVKAVGEKQNEDTKPVAINSDVLDTGTGKFLFFEPLSGVCIRGSKAYVHRKIDRINLWIKDICNYKHPDDEYYLTVADVVNALYEDACKGTVATIIGWHPVDLPNGGLRIKLNESTIYKYPNSDKEEPAYIIRIIDPVELVPNYAPTYPGDVGDR